MANSRNKPSPELTATVAAVLRRHVAARQRVVAGFSGGLDSVVLLHLLHQLQPQFGFSLAALHVNHHLSPNADNWARSCAEICSAWEIPLQIFPVDVAHDSGLGLEGAARRARYAAFSQADADWLALAHQRDDQAETLLFNLLRGAGVRGAAAMPEVRVLRQESSTQGALRILRPLLDLSRSVLEDYARRHGLGFVEDESNLDTRHGRNFLRHEIMPELRQRFPGCDEALARAAQHFGEAQTLLDALAEIDYQALATDDRIDVSGLAVLGEARAKNLLRHYLHKHKLSPPNSVQLADWLNQLLYAAADSRIALDLEAATLHRYHDQIWLARDQDAAPLQPLVWQGEEQVAWGGGRLIFTQTKGEGIASERLARGQVTITRRQGGERLKLDARRPCRTLKNLLQEARIPPWQRERLPLLYCGEELVWVAGIGTASDYHCLPHEAGWQVKWRY